MQGFGAGQATLRDRLPWQRCPAEVRRGSHALHPPPHPRTIPPHPRIIPPPSCLMDSSRVSSSSSISSDARSISSSFRRSVDAWPEDSSSMDCCLPCTPREMAAGWLCQGFSGLRGRGIAWQRPASSLNQRRSRPHAAACEDKHCSMHFCPPKPPLPPHSPQTSHPLMNALICAPGSSRSRWTALDIDDPTFRSCRPAFAASR